MTVAAAVASTPIVVAAHAILRGQVQGLGVRPAIANLANRHRLSGSVGNVTGGVAILIEGSPQCVARFQQDLPFAIPREAVVEKCEWSEAASRDFQSFTIVQTAAHEKLETPVPSDRATCGDCLRETTERTSRRRGYAFTSCTKCGPRFSIITSMPYERAATTMHEFPLCTLCAQEYSVPSDRRYHAQTNACANCGPKLWSCDRRGRVAEDQQDVLARAASEIRSGGIVGLRGIGGYQLVCDATNCEAVRRLRHAKRRPDKPFAVMISESSASDHKTDMSLSEWEAMTGAENPVVIRSMLADMTLSPEVSRGLSSVGLMLPTTPLHALLAEACEVPLVVTSGNIDGDPLTTDVNEAERSLGEIANLFLHHDRPIAHPVDDSVVRLIAGRATTIRLARGLAPLSLAIASSNSCLALGGHQKVAIALSNGAQAVLGPHLGDLDTVSMRNRFEAHVDEMLALYGCSPEFVVVDRHPDYFTSRWIEQFEVPRITVEETVPREEPAIRPTKASPSPRSHLGSVRHLVRVQHHHAHIAAAMIERGWQDREVLGVAFDGTGYGPDGTIWGGEFLLSSLKAYRRVGRLRPFALLGGELAIREPWRVALSLVAEVLPTSTLDEACRRFLPPEVAWQAALAAQANRRLAPLTTSAGRLFDGVAALVLQIYRASFEGQPAMHLEDCCDHLERRSYDFSIHPGEVFELDWRPAVATLVNDLHAGESPERIAMKFHHGLARGIALMCEHFPQQPVVLGGGVFQNRLLVEGIADRIPANRLGLPGRIPPNDGGLAAGQLAIATEVISSLRHH